MKDSAKAAVSDLLPAMAKLLTSDGLELLEVLAFHIDRCFLLAFTSCRSKGEGTGIGLGVSSAIGSGYAAIFDA